MQKVQLFRFSRAKVRGPMGIYEEERMAPTGADSIHHAGKEYRAGEDGWISVPTEVYEAVARMRHKHPHGGYTKWCTPGDVDEPERLGLVDRPERPRARAK